MREGIINYLLLLIHYFLYAFSRNCNQQSIIGNSFFPLICLLFLLPVSILAQSEINSPNEPQILVDINTKARKYFNSAPDTAKAIAQDALQLAVRLNRPQSQADAYITLGLAEMSLGNWTVAEGHYRNAMQGYRTAGDSTGVATALIHLGYSYSARGFINKALQYQLNSLRLREKYSKNPLVLASSYGAIGLIYENLGDLKNAMEFAQKAFKIRLQSNIPIPAAMGFSLKNIGRIYFLQKDYDLALNFYQAALDTFVRHNNYQFVQQLNQYIGAVYRDKKQYELAEKHFLESLTVAQKIGGGGIKAKIYGELGNLYKEMGRLNEAEKHYLQTIEIAKGTDDQFSIYEKGHLALAELYETKGQYADALDRYKAYITVKDSLFNENSSRELAELRTQYETEQKVALLEEKQKRHTRERNLLIFGLLLLVGLGFLLFRESRKKQGAFEELQKTQTQLIQGEKMASLGQLTAGIAHEINNPINFVSSNVHALKLDFEDLQPLLEKVQELEHASDQKEVIEEIIHLNKNLETNYLAEEIHQLIEGIERGASRTHNIVLGLRTFARSTGNEYIKANLHQGLESTLTILNSKIGHRIKVHKNFQEIPLVECHFDKINQVFMNILNNAIDAIPEDGDIYISTTQQEDQVFIEIKDSGKGMDTTTQQRIFEPFFTTKDIGKGTGLGMAISYGIVQQHQGSISLESELGRGSTFTIGLPVKQKPVSS